MNENSPYPYAVRGQLEIRDIDTLTTHPKQGHYFPSEAGVPSMRLAKRISKNGLTEAIEITPGGMVISGHRRVDALKFLKPLDDPGPHMVEVRVRYDLAALGEDAIEQRLISANLDRRQLSPLEQLRLEIDSAKLGDKLGDKPLNMIMLLRELSFQRKVSIVTLQRSLELLGLPVELQRLIDDKKLPRQLGKQLLDHATPTEIEELRQLAENGDDRKVTSLARKLMMDRVPPRNGKKSGPSGSEPGPENVLERFLEVSIEMAVDFDAIVAHVGHNLRDSRVMRRCLRGLRRAELVVPLLLEIVTRSDRLDPEDLADRATLGKHSIADFIATLTPELKQLKKLPPPETIKPDLPPLKLKQDLPPLVLKKDPPPLKLRSLPGDSVPTSSS